MRSLKKLLHMAILTEDKILQMSQLNRIYAWFTERECAQMTKEDLFTAKVRQDVMLKKQAMKDIVSEQHAMTQLPPIQPVAPKPIDPYVEQINKEKQKIAEVTQMSEIEYLKKQIRERCHARRELAANGGDISPIRVKKPAQSVPAAESVEAKTSKGKKGKKKTGAATKAKVKAAKVAEEGDEEKPPMKPPLTD